MISPKKIAKIEARAKGGDAGAIYDLAQRSLSGDSFPKDAKRARDLITRAAEADYAKAVFLLGVWAQTGEHGAEDPTKAAAYYKRAGELGHGRAWLNLGILQQVGLGLDADLNAAAESYKKGAGCGAGQAAANLGNLYETGMLNKGEPNFEDAAHWYRRAIQLGYAEARASLDALHEAAGIPALMTDTPRAKSSSLWKRLLGLK